jgi:type I restriction enzyme S subunit
MLSPKAKTGTRYRPYLRNTNVQWGRFDLEDVAQMDFEEDEEVKFVLRSGDLLVCEGGEPGRAAVWQGQIDPCFYQKALHRLRPIRDDVSSSFIMYRLWLVALSGEFGGSHAKTTIAHLPAVRLASLQMAVPSREEQRRIVDALDECFAVAERARVAAEARLGAITAMVDAFARSVFRGSASEQWPRRQLAAVADVAGGLQKTPDRAPRKNAVPYLTVRNVQRGSLDLSHVEEFEVTPTELSRLRLLDGDVLIVEGNGGAEQIGRNALFTAQGVDWIHQNHVIRVRLRRDTALPEFVSVFLNSEEGRSQMLQKARTTSGLYSLSVGKVGELEVPLPSMDEQCVLAESLREQRTMVDRARLAMQDAISAIRALPGALLRRAFSEEV